MGSAARRQTRARALLNAERTLAAVRADQGTRWERDTRKATAQAILYAKQALR